MDWTTAEGHPECFYNRTCRPFNISNFVPMDWALPLYGYWMPIIVCLTLATNSFIVLVLSHKYLRTPTNYVLLAMAVSELFTGISCIPWFIYYFTLGGHKDEALYGLPEIWCRISPYVAAILPSIFHSTAIWLTVYLAIQRYVYICVPTLVRRFCTLDRSKQVTLFICLFSVIIYTPELMASYTFSHTLFDPIANISRRFCYKQQTSVLRSVGNLYYKALYIGQCTLVHLMPCILLVIFTWKLVDAIRVADRRHAHLLSKASNRKSVMSHDSVDESTKRLSRLSKPRESISEPKRVQGLKQNTRMLVVVISIFLITEIPAAIIFIIHVLSVSLGISIIDYRLINILLIVRNVLIVSSYPFRFAIYCGMSQQFRDVVKQMFTGRFFPQLIGDKDNSTTMVLVHVENNSEDRRSALLVQNGKAGRSSLPKTSLLNKPNEKCMQCNISESSELVPFDPYLSDLNVLVEVPSESYIYTTYISHNQRDVSTQVECRLALIASRRESMVTAALKEQCHVMLQQAL